MEVMTSLTIKLMRTLPSSQYSRCIIPLYQSTSQFSTQSNKTRLFPEELNIIYDGKCNICKLEMDFLAKRDTQKINIGAPKLKLTDLEGAYNENDPINGGVSYKEGMTAIHAVTAEGNVIKGVPVFLLAYEKVNLGWLFQVTTLPIVKQIVELGYIIFAKYRTSLTRGESIDALVEQYEARKEFQKQLNMSCDDNVCQTKIK